MKVRVGRTKCAGIGICEMTAPTVFEVGEDGQSHVLREEPAAEDMAAVEEAVANCPTESLSIER
jgi:ferredoxin